MHHFRFVSGSPGAVFVKSDSSAAERKINLLKDTSWAPSVHQLPLVIISMGLSAERQLYLYEKIREFCPPEKQDSVCPKPVKLLVLMEYTEKKICLDLSRFVNKKYSIVNGFYQ